VTFSGATDPTYNFGLPRTSREQPYARYRERLRDAPRSGMDADDRRARLNRYFLLYLRRDKVIRAGSVQYDGARLGSIPHPVSHASALFVSLVEFVSGAGLVVGLLTPLCALALAIDMIVAVATNRIQSIQASGVLAWLDDFLYLPEVPYAMILVWLIFSGPGRYSLDRLIGRRYQGGC